MTAELTKARSSAPGVSPNGQKIRRFLANKLEAVRRLDLVQVITEGEGEREARVDGWPVPEGTRAAELAAEIEEVALSDASALGGVNVYAVVAYGEGREILGRTTFRTQGETRADITPNERPTLLGMRAQEMRHNEMYAQLAVRVSLEQIESYREMVAEARQDARDARKELAEANAKRVETIQLYESLASEKAKRDLDAQREARHERAQAEILGKLGTLWPLLVHKLAGGSKGSASSFAPDVQMLLSHLLANITKEDVHRMAAQLSPEKALILWEVIAGLIPAPATTPPPATNGTTNGAGGAS